MQYLYNEGDLYYFMDLENYEQIPINKSVLNDNFKFVKEEMPRQINVVMAESMDDSARLLSNYNLTKDNITIIAEAELKEIFKKYDKKANRPKKLANSLFLLYFYVFWQYQGQSGRRNLCRTTFPAAFF